MIEKFKSNAEAIAVADKYLYGNHARMPIVMDHGEGAWVWDLDGNKFLDFVGGIAVNGLGHNHPAIVKALDRAKGLEGKCVALTFDDGPNEDCTEKLLDGLKERNVRATFFLMGQNIEGNEEIVKRMKAEGHLIGNHSYSHVQLTKAGSDAVCQAVDRTSRMIEEITGERPQYMRPPYGDWNEELECRVGMTTVLWSVDSLDWKLRNTNRVVKRVLKDVEDGDIILMHDIFPTSVEAALEIVDTLTKRGYTFVTVDELLID